jgi:hypothetical protein
MAKYKQHGASDPRAAEHEEDEAPEALRAPDRDEPYWRYPDGERLSVRLLLAGQPAPRAERIVALHAEAVASLVHGAGEAIGRGEHAEMRRLAHRAGRLCDELAGVPGPGGSRARG